MEFVKYWNYELALNTYHGYISILFMSGEEEGIIHWIQSIRKTKFILANRFEVLKIIYFSFIYSPRGNDWRRALVAPTFLLQKSKTKDILPICQSEGYPSTTTWLWALGYLHENTCKGIPHFVLDLDPFQKFFNFHRFPIDFSNKNEKYPKCTKVLVIWFSQTEYV